MGRAERGLLWAVASAAGFGTSGTFVTSLLRAGWSPAAAVIVRIAVAGLALTLPAVLQLRGNTRQLRAAAGKVAGYGAFAIAGAQLCFFNAVHHLSVAVALLLEYSGILLVGAWQWVRHGQRPSRLAAAGSAAAIAGLVLVLDLTGSEHVDGIGIGWGLGAAVGLAVYFVASAHSENPLPPLLFSWAGMVVGVALLGLLALVRVLPVNAATTDVVLRHHRLSFLVPVLGMSLIAAAFAYVTGIVGARLLGARLSSFVSLAEVLFAAVFAWVGLGEALGPMQIVGGLLVVAGIVLVRLGEPGVAEHLPSTA